MARGTNGDGGCPYGVVCAVCLARFLIAIRKKSQTPRLFRACDSLPIRPSNARDVFFGYASRVRSERAGLVLYLNRVEIRRVRGIWGVRHILSGGPRLSFGSLSGCVRVNFSCVPGCIGSSPCSISCCICISPCGVPGCIGSRPGSVSGCICARYASSFAASLAASASALAASLAASAAAFAASRAASASFLAASLAAFASFLAASLAASAASLSSLSSLSRALPGPLFPATPPWSASPRPGPA